MTREAAREGFGTYVDRTIEVTVSEFDVVAALRRGTDGGRAVDRLLDRTGRLKHRVVEPELAAFRADVLAQFDAVLDCAADPDATVYDRREAVLGPDAYHDALRPTVAAERRAEIAETLLARQARVADSVAPLVAAPEDSFWPAVESALDREQALDLVATTFDFTGPLDEHGDAFAFSTTVDPAEVLGGLGGLLGRGLPTLEVEYTDEAARAMRRAERRVKHEAEQDVRERFAGDD